jgi:hypothetical protein
MNKFDFWYRERDERLIRYANRKLDPGRWITLRAEPDYAATYEGQVAILTAANLIGRMSPSVALDLPKVRMVHPLPWAGMDLREFALEQCLKNDPNALFCIRSLKNSDYLLQFGPSGASQVIHGSGWHSYIGPPTSPLQNRQFPNPIGPALSAIAAATQLFVGDFPEKLSYSCLNAFNWSQKFGPDNISPIENQNLGNVWFVGIGSVGTAILYFLTLITRNFSPTLFDMDIIERLNITRSPIFIENHVGIQKVEAAKLYLESCGVSNIITEPRAFHESPLWSLRDPSTIDLLVPAANEFNVRQQIESLHPPIQIYGTTGKNWQSSMIRHIPSKDPCSCCLFPSQDYTPTECAVDSKIVSSPGEEIQIDASIPFLSFAAGLMAAAEIMKLSLPSYPFTANRAFLYSKPELRLSTAQTGFLKGCICGKRNRNTYRKILSGTVFENVLN